MKNKSKKVYTPNIRSEKHLKNLKVLINQPGLILFQSEDGFTYQLVSNGVNDGFSLKRLLVKEELPKILTGIPVRHK